MEYVLQIGVLKRNHLKISGDTGFNQSSDKQCIFSRKFKQEIYNGFQLPLFLHPWTRKVHSKYNIWFSWTSLYKHALVFCISELMKILLMNM